MMRFMILDALHCSNNVMVRHSTGAVGFKEPVKGIPRFVIVVVVIGK
jgi:hypothetical protein